jgi:hypothetical protein
MNGTTETSRHSAKVAISHRSLHYAEGQSRGRVEQKAQKLFLIVEQPTEQQSRFHRLSEKGNSAENGRSEPMKRRAEGDR